MNFYQSQSQQQTQPQQSHAANTPNTNLMNHNFQKNTNTALAITFILPSIIKSSRQGTFSLALNNIYSSLGITYKTIFNSVYIYAPLVYIVACIHSAPLTDL